MDMPTPDPRLIQSLSGAMDHAAPLGTRVRSSSYRGSHGKGTTVRPMKVDTTLRALHAINTAHQEIEFLQQVRNHGTHLEVVQDAHRIEWHRWDSSCALLLWIDNEPPIPRDDVHPEWDTPSPLRELLLESPVFPHAVLWSPSMDSDLESPWQATHWWPTPGVTDAIDDPSSWLQWWWSTIMNEKSEPPSLQTIFQSVT